MSDKIFIDGDFNGSYESRVKRAKGKAKAKIHLGYPALCGDLNGFTTNEINQVNCHDCLKVKEEKK